MKNPTRNIMHPAYGAGATIIACDDGNMLANPLAPDTGIPNKTPALETHLLRRERGEDDKGRTGCSIRGFYFFCSFLPTLASFSLRFFFVAREAPPKLLVCSA